MYDFDTFVKENAKLINKLIGKFKVRNYSVDDIRQEILLVAWTAIQKYDPSRGSQLVSFFYMLVNQHMQKLIKEQTPYPNTNFDDLDRDGAFLTDDTTIKEQDKKANQDILWDYIGTLKYGYILRWHYVGGMSIKRIAHIEKVTIHNIYKRIRILERQVKENFPDIKTYL